MTYSLPFDLKQKPIRKYFEGGSINFIIREGKMFYRVTTTKTIHLIRPERYVKERYPYKEVKSKEQLDKLLTIKSLSEIPLIDCVIQNSREVKHE